MKASALKDKIIKRVGEIDDPAVLNDVISLLELEDKMVIKLSDAEKAFIQEGIDDIEAGRVVSHEEVMKNPRKWLEK